MKKADIEKSFGSNTCRCTGYRSILDTMKSFAVDASPSLLKTVTDIEDLSIESKCRRKCSSKSDDSDWCIIEKQCNNKAKLLTYYFEEGQKFFKVHEVHEIFNILNDVGYDSYMLVAGNTGKGGYTDFYEAIFYLSFAGAIRDNLIILLLPVIKLKTAMLVPVSHRNKTGGKTITIMCERTAVTS